MPDTQFVLLEVLEQGARLVADDASSWAVAPADRATVVGWQAASAIEAEFDEAGADYPWRLRSLITEETVAARPETD